MVAKISNPKIALLLLTLFSFSSGCLITYFGSMITTLEKRFNWPTVQIGWLMSANDIAYLVTIMFVAYYGGKGRQSLVLSCSAFGFFLSVLVFIMPFFIWGPKYSPSDILRNETTVADELAENSSSRLTEDQNTIDTTVPEMEKTLAFVIQFAAGLISGFAATPFWNVGLALIDDMSGKNNGLFIGFLLLVRTLSPICGYLFGGFMTSINESLILKATDFYQGTKDPRWVGAWWLGYLILGILMLISCPLMALLDVPKLRKAGEEGRKAMNDEKERKFVSSTLSLNDDTDTAVPTTIDFSKIKFSEFIKESINLFSNPVYTFLYLGIISEITAFMILHIYFPKYIESHFHQNTNTASFMSSISLAGGTALAVMISGLISKLIQMTTTQMNLYNMVVKIISALVFPLLFLFRCEKIDLIQYSNFYSHPSMQEYQTCVNASSCSGRVYNPVCVDGKNFMSPCFAGCEQFNKTTSINCLCSNLTASKDLCTSECNNVYIYLAIFFLVRVINGISTVQSTMIIMRLPKNPDFKPLAMAYMTIFWGIMGMVTPPIAGKIIDTVCIAQSPSPDGSRSFCLYYDTDKFRVLIHSIATFFQIPSCIFYIIGWRFSRTRYPTKKDPVYLRKRRKEQEKTDNAELQKMKVVDS